VLGLVLLVIVVILFIVLSSKGGCLIITKKPFSSVCISKHRIWNHRSQSSQHFRKHDNRVWRRAM